MQRNIEEKVKKFEYHKKNCEKMVDTLKSLLEGSDIIDAGSNVGFFSQSIAEMVKYSSIHLFEPSKEYCEYSAEALQNYKNIYINNFGLGDTAETKILYKSPTENLGWNTFLEADPYQKNNSFLDKMIKEECVIKRLDDYKIDNVDFIKIDVEGFEHKVISGGLNLIQKFKPVLFVEVGWGVNHPNWSECEKVYNKLFEIGYKKVNFGPHTQDVLFVLDIE